MDIDIIILNTIEFTSARKKMSIFIYYENKVIMLTKGADSVMLPISTSRLSEEEINQYLNCLHA